MLLQLAGDILAPAEEELELRLAPLALLQVLQAQREPADLRFFYSLK